MNRQIIKALFPKAIENIDAGKCAFCEKEIKDEEFKNEESKKEFEISGLCQQCQDEVYG